MNNSSILPSPVDNFPCLNIVVQSSNGDYVESAILAICFTFASVGNVTMFFILIQNIDKVRANRMYLLLLHLNIADLIVTFGYMLPNIIYKILSLWYGTAWMCKAAKFIDVIGFYVSSNILVCMSVDRLVAIVLPLYSMRALNYVKAGLVISWLLAIASSSIQIPSFDLIYHPNCTHLVKCATPKDLDLTLIWINTDVNLVEIFILPTTVIVTCYSLILFKIIKKDKAATKSTSSRGQSGASEHSTLRRSSNFLKKAKSRTLRMSVVIVVLFLLCWAPYFVTSIYFLTYKSIYGSIPPYLKTPHGEIIYHVISASSAVNSSINPFVYGMFSFKIWEELHKLCPKVFKAPVNTIEQERSTYKLTVKRSRNPSVGSEIMASSLRNRANEANIELLETPPLQRSRTKSPGLVRFSIDSKGSL